MGDGNDTNGIKFRSEVEKVCALIQYHIPPSVMERTDTYQDHRLLYNESLITLWKECRKAFAAGDTNAYFKAFDDWQKREAVSLNQIKVPIIK